MGTKPALLRVTNVTTVKGGIIRLGRIVALCGIGLAVANCSGSSKLTSKVDPKYGVTASPRVVAAGQAVPKGGGAYRVGKPYQVAGKTYVPKEVDKYKAEGVASWYGDDFHGRLTANGEVFDMHSIAAAHPTLPMPSYVRVTNVDNGHSMVVRVNDRGPFHGNRLIDVSQKAADMLGFKHRGTARVKIEYVGRAPLEGSDDIQLAATLRKNGKPVTEPTVMVASVAPLRGVTATPPTSASVPLPPGRPFELGGSFGQQVAVSAAPQAPARTVQRQPAQVASAPAVRPQATQQAPVRAMQVASVQPPAQQKKVAAPTTASSELPTGWVVGAQPAMSYTSSGSAQGLY